jgi:hypothetical protein
LTNLSTTCETSWLSRPQLALCLVASCLTCAPPASAPGLPQLFPAPPLSQSFSRTTFPEPTHPELQPSPPNQPPPLSSQARRIQRSPLTPRPSPSHATFSSRSMTPTTIPYLLHPQRPLLNLGHLSAQPLNSNPSQTVWPLSSRLPHQSLDHENGSPCPPTTEA